MEIRIICGSNSYKKLRFYELGTCVEKYLYETLCGRISDFEENYSVANGYRVLFILNVKEFEFSACIIFFFHSGIQYFQHSKC